MLLFSTVLFVDGNPVGYEVHQEKTRLVLDPAVNPNPHVYPPVLYARNDHDQWCVEGTHCRDLIDQVREDLSIYYSNTGYPWAKAS